MRDLFDLVAAKAAAEAGIGIAASARPDGLAAARALARDIAMQRSDRCCTVHDVRREWVRLDVVGCHAHRNPRWRLRGN